MVGVGDVVLDAVDETAQSRKAPRSDAYTRVFFS